MALSKFLKSRQQLRMLICGCIAFSSTVSIAQVRETGNVSSVKINGQSVEIRTDNSFVTATVYSADIIRIRMDKKALEADHSYAVVAEPQKVKATITQSANDITILTDSLKAIIQKKPYSIAFYTPDGRVINEDEKGLTTSWVGEEATTYKHMQDGERFIGLGEKTGDLDRKGSGYTNWNTDAFAYSASQDPIYSTVPFYYGIHHDINYGIFLDNTYRTDFNFGASNNRFSSFAAQGGEMNYYFIYDNKLSDIIKAYTWLTGRMKLPPMWSLGYQQNRYSYYPDTEVLRIAQTLREKKIPADGITLDIHYMDRYQLFTWNKERFPNPQALTAKLKDMGFRTTVIVDPGIKVNPGAPAFDRGLKADAYIKYVDGQYYTGQVWPGWCHFTDYTSEKGRDFWRKEMKFFSDNGVSGIWNDMNEIATWGQKFPSNVIFDWEGKKTTNLQAHNVYGSLMARTSYEGLKANTNERPFILTRAGYAGMQRFTAIWTGDNRSEDSHMLAGVRLLTSLGVSGVPFTGMDIGGFTGGASTELFARWMQMGAFTPYFRNHAALNTKSAEPWTFGEEVTEISRNYVNLRYKLLPYTYSTFYEATQDGMPVVRTLAIDNAFDKNVYNTAYQNQFMTGQSLLIVPVESGKAFTKLYLPKGNWYNLYNDEYSTGNAEKIIELTLSKLPVYVKESSIIPMQTLVQSTSIAPSDTLMLHVYKGTIPNTFVYYEDDGRTFNYESGAFYKRMISYDPASGKITLDAAEGSLASKFNNIAVILHGWDSASSLTANGSNMSLQKTSTSLLAPISQFDPTGAEKSSGASNTFTSVIKNSREKITIQL